MEKGGQAIAYDIGPRKHVENFTVTSKSLKRRDEVRSDGQGAWWKIKRVHTLRMSIYPVLPDYEADRFEHLRFCVAVTDQREDEVGSRDW